MQSGACRDDRLFDSPRGFSMVAGMTRDVHRDFECCVKAVQTVFRHLALDAIKHPPRPWLDAALARQIAWHVMARHLSWPVRRVASDVGAGRGAMHRALCTVRDRIDASEEFASAYELIARRSEHLIAQEAQANG